MPPGFLSPCVPFRKRQPPGALPRPGEWGPQSRQFLRQHPPSSSRGRRAAQPGYSLAARQLVRWNPEFGGFQLCSVTRGSASFDAGFYQNRCQQLSSLSCASAWVIRGLSGSSNVSLMPAMFSACAFEQEHSDIGCSSRTGMSSAAAPYPIEPLCRESAAANFWSVRPLPQFRQPVLRAFHRAIP